MRFVYKPGQLTISRRHIDDTPVLATLLGTLPFKAEVCGFKSALLETKTTGPIFMKPVEWCVMITSKQSNAHHSFYVRAMNELPNRIA